MLTELVENLLNRNLGASPRARELCAALRGRRLRITLSGLGVRIGLESLGSTLRIARDPDGDFDDLARVHMLEIFLHDFIGDRT